MSVFIAVLVCPKPNISIKDRPQSFPQQTGVMAELCTCGHTLLATGLQHMNSR